MIGRRIVFQLPLAVVLALVLVVLVVLVVALALLLVLPLKHTRPQKRVWKARPLPQTPITLFSRAFPQPPTAQDKGTTLYR
jgi:hypothetical protein